jgi:hypothetical protein
MSRHPAPFNQEYADILCGEIATCPESLARIVKRLQGEHENFPVVSTLFKWLRENESFSNQYAGAKESQSDILVDEILEIVDDESGDENGSVAVQRAKLRLEARKWIASKLKPKSYGDRLDISGKITSEHSLGGLLLEIATNGQTSLIGSTHEEALLIPSDTVQKVSNAGISPCLTLPDSRDIPFI